MKKISLIIGIIFYGLNLSGQTVWIDSLYANPQSLTIEDTIQIIGEIRTPSAGCDLTSTETEIDQTNKIVTITSCYAIGPLDTICPSIDTFLVGQLQEGEYQVILKAKGFETLSIQMEIALTLSTKIQKKLKYLLAGQTRQKVK